MMRMEKAFNQVKDLVADFDQNKEYYLDTKYSEIQARKDFIDKFWIALGWDVNHEVDKNPYEQEVKIELNVDVQGRKKRADYAFYIKPNYRDVCFYVEAKKPAIEIANADDYFQTIRYGYNSDTPIAVLTDFEQFHILDCRYSPSIETALDRFVKRFHYKEYLEKDKFAEIYWLFSREAVENGSIDKRALELPKARGGAVQLGLFKGAYKPIDAALLDELDEYRDKLAHAFKNGNPSLGRWDLTEIVQRVIDRLVFIRFLEDKLIEPEEIISTFGTKSESVWKDFVAVCRKLDKIYNGTIYKKHDILDNPDFNINENIFADICEKLSDKNTPYDFNVIPIHILGSIYERFLGKVITTTAKRATVEDKPEVKKAGGVFYTPEYIVRYIVENTIGKQIEGKTPEEITSMRFADIACGSGSFLIGAYDYLLRYHAKYYNGKKEKVFEKDYVQREGGNFLSLHKKRDILINNIYGVDIDQQAVEVAQLSLYLKLLENETLGSTTLDRRNEEKEKVLPYLGKNIQCGNSLIETDFEEGKQLSLFDKDYERTINMFNWKDNYSSVMKEGGFDAIFGNPPYGADLTADQREYLVPRYPIGSTDTAALFMIKCFQLCKKNAYNGLIVPKAFTYSSGWKKTREKLLDNIIEVADVGKVWKEVKLEQCIYNLQKGVQNKNYICAIRQKNSILPLSSITKKVSYKFDCILNGVDRDELEIGLKIFNSKYRLSNFFDNSRGDMLQNKIVQDGKGLIVLSGKQIGDFSIRGIKGVITEFVKVSEKAFIKENSVLVQNIVSHIENPIGHIKVIATVVPDEIRKSHVIIDTVNQLTSKGEINAESCLCVITSSLMNWYLYRFVFGKAIRTMHFDGPVTDKIPFPNINLSDQARLKEFTMKKATLIDESTKQKSDFNKNSNSRKIEAVNNKIDELVYDLFGLTKEEITLVENYKCKDL